MGQNRHVRDTRIVVYTVNVISGGRNGLAKVIRSVLSTIKYRCLNEQTNVNIIILQDSPQHFVFHLLLFNSGEVIQMVLFSFELLCSSIHKVDGAQRPQE